MKKISIFLLTIICIITCPACRIKEEKKKDEKKLKIDIKSAQNTVDFYMRQLSEDNYIEARKIYTKKLAQGSVDKIDDNLKIRGYRIIQTSETGDAVFIKVRISKMDITKPNCILDESIFKVVKIDNEYKIDEINSIAISEIFKEDGSLRFKNRANVKTNVLIYKDSFPKYTFSKDDLSSLNEIPIVKSDFNLANLDYSGEKAVISLKGEYTYIGAVIIDESLEAANDQGDSDQKSGDGQPQGQGGQGEEIIKAREKPIGSNLIDFDILKDTDIESMLFSHDAKYVLVQYSNGDGLRCIRVYSSDSGDLIPFKFEENFNVNEVDVVFDYFDKDIINFDVKPKKGKEENQKDVIGKWQLNLKGFKVEKK